MRKDLSNGIKLGSIIWFLAFVYATTIMLLVGVDFSDTENPFGIHHEKYWLVELIMQPSFLIFVTWFLIRHFKANTYEDKELWILGVVMAAVQFILDLFVIVIALGNGLEYFVALVSLVYVLIPFYVYYLGKRYRSN